MGEHDPDDAQLENEEIVIPINAYDSDEPPMVTPDQPEPDQDKKKSKGFMSKAKGMFTWKSKPKSESDPESGKAIPSADESDNNEDPKQKKKGYWRRTKGWFSKKGKGAAIAVGLKKKEDDDKDRGAACCCPGLEYKTRMTCAGLSYLLGLVSFVAAMFFIWPDLPKVYHTELFPVFYVVGCVMTIGAVFFLAGVCRQIRVSMRYGRWTALLIVTASILVTSMWAFRMCYYQPKKVNKAGTTDSAADTPSSTPATPAADPKKPKRVLPNNPDRPKHWILLAILIAQNLAWFWYLLSYMPCGRKIVHCCCKKSKDKDKKKDDA